MLHVRVEPEIESLCVCLLMANNALTNYLFTRRTTSQERLHTAASGSLLYDRRHEPRQNNTRADSCWSRHQQPRQPQVWQVSYRARHSTSAAQLCTSVTVARITGRGIDIGYTAALIGHKDSSDSDSFYRAMLRRERGDATVYRLSVRPSVRL